MEIRVVIRKVCGILFVSILLLVLFQAQPKEPKAVKVYTLSETEVFGNGLEWEVVQTHLPIFAHMFHKQNENNGYEVMIGNASPLYQYLLKQEAIAKNTENKTDLVWVFIVCTP